MLKSSAHIAVTVDEGGNCKIYTNMDDTREIAYILLHLANDLMGRLDEFEKEMLGKYKEKVEEQIQAEEKIAKDAEIDDMAKEFNKGE